MTHVTVSTGRNMVIFLTYGYYTIVTGITATSHLIVINLGRRRPARLTMTTFTVSRGINVLVTLTLCRGSIMTGKTCG